MIGERNPALDSLADIIADETKPDQLIAHAELVAFARRAGLAGVNNVPDLISRINARLRARHIVLNNERGAGWRRLIANHVLPVRVPLRKKRIISQVNASLRELRAVDPSQLSDDENRATADEQGKLAAIRLSARQNR